MKIIIPMSGTGQRFIAAGYTTPKPLIEVNGKTIIEHVIALFPGEEDFIFICRAEHLANTNLRAILLAAKPKAQIVSMPGSKLGPVVTTLEACHLIGDNEPVMISYCDYFMDWDYADFKKTVLENGCDASVPAYTGFHPHLLHAKNLYASMRTDAYGYMLEIKEKFSFTTDKEKSPHSPGVFYFKKGSYIKKYFQQLIDEKVELNGEYYISLVYNLLARDGLKIFVYDKILHFMQWGTPEDLEEYLYWSALFERLASAPGSVSMQDITKDYYSYIHGKDEFTLQKIYSYWQHFFHRWGSHPYKEKI